MKDTVRKQNFANYLAVLHVDTDANTVNLLVDLGPVVVALLTGTGNSKLDAGRMPGTDTGNLAETLVRLARELLGAPTGRDALEPLALGDADAVDHLVLGEDGANWDLLLQVALGPLDLLLDRPAVELDLHDVGLLLAQLDQLHLHKGHEGINHCFLRRLSVKIDRPVHGLDYGQFLGLICNSPLGGFMSIYKLLYLKISSKLSALLEWRISHTTQFYIYL